jgi:type 1 glutamine amidotransferase
MSDALDDASVTDVTDIDPKQVESRIKSAEDMKALKAIINELVPSRLVTGQLIQHRCFCFFI